MSSTYGENIKLTIFGQSHSPAIGVTIDGIPAGEKIDYEELERFMARRAPGKNEYSTQRRESDRPEILCGIKDGATCGAPITAIIRNSDARSADYEEIRHVPRPGHADYTAELKYGGCQDPAGGGHFSGRLTAPMCIAGGICCQILEREGINIISRIVSIGNVIDDSELIYSTAEKSFPAVSDEIGEEMKKAIAEAKEQGDSLGGVVECKITGLPVGLGDPMFNGMENRIAAIVFGIPAVKGLEFGDGFASARLRGSDNNDAFHIAGGKITTLTNHSGGILGGITNGMPLIFRASFKPTPSIAKEQQSVDLKTGQNTTITIPGRHDPCIVPRAVPVIEAAASIAVYDAYLNRKKET